ALDGSEGSGGSEERERERNTSLSPSLHCWICGRSLSPAMLTWHTPVITKNIKANVTILFVRLRCRLSVGKIYLGTIIASNKGYERNYCPCTCRLKVTV